MAKRTTLLMICLLAAATFVIDAQQPATPSIVPAPDRRPDEGIGPFPTLTIRNVMVIDGTGAPPFGPANVVVERNRIARITNAGTPGVPAPSRAAETHRRRSHRRHRHVPHARFRQPAHPSGRPAEGGGGGVCLQALHGARRHYGPWRRVGRAAIRAERKGAERRQRDCRAAHLQLSAAWRGLDRRNRGHAGESSSLGALVCGERRGRHEARRPSAGDHGALTRRGEKARTGIDGAPGTARRRADECADRRQARARDRHALLRTLRSASPRFRSTALAAKHELQRRAIPVWSGRATLGPDPSAGQPRVEGVSAGTHQARHRSSTRR